LKWRGAGGPNCFQTLERQRKVRAPLGWDERVDFVDDHRVDGAQRVAGVRRQKQVQRLRRCNQDIRGVALEARAFDCGRVARPDRDRRQAEAVATSCGPVGDTRQRRAQVPLDVNRERLERR
jgi:hypothetical protein